MKKRAWTVLELLVVVAILALGLSLGMVGLKAPAVSLQSKSLAQLLLARLGQARQRAIASGEPVALAFPCVAGARQSQSCYLLQGDRSPRRVAAWNWLAELPQAFCYYGEWPLDSPASWSSSGLDFSAWAPPQPQDALLVFSPGGSLQSNLPFYQGNYHLVTCTALSGSLQSVSNPWTVHLSPSGSTRLTPGLDQGSAVSQPARAAFTLSALPLPGPSLNLNPLLDQVTPLPTPPAGSLPAGIDASVRPDGCLTFEVRAHDPDADVLRCFWETSQGQLSSQQEARMEWDQADNRWVSRWSFSPPPGADVGTIYTLSCRVRDSRGGEVTGTFGVAGRVIITHRPRLCFSSSVETLNPLLRNLYVSNFDGTERKLVFDGRGTVDCPRWSPDGSLIMFFYDPTGGINLQLWVVRPDGSGLKRLIDPASYGWVLIAGSVFTPDGTKIIVEGFRNANHDLVWINVDGTRPSAPTLPGTDPIALNLPGKAAFTGMDIHPTTGHVLCANLDGTLHLFKTDGTELPVSQPPLPPGNANSQVAFSPDGNTLYLNNYSRTIESAPFTHNGSSATVGPSTYILGTAADPAQGPHTSHDGQFLFFERGAPLIQLFKRDLVTGVEFPLSPPGVFEDDVWSSI